MKSKAILTLAVFFTFFTFFIFTTVSAVSAFERCIMCGMDSQKSETKFTAQVIKGTKDVPSGEYSFCCLHCLLLFKTMMKEGKIGAISVRDYNTVTEKYDSGEMVNATQAFYLIESDLRPKGSMVPFMLIFSTQKTAEIFKKAYGGKILDWKEVWAYTEARK